MEILDTLKAVTLDDKELHQKAQALAVTYGVNDEFQGLPVPQAVMLVASEIAKKSTTNASQFVLGRTLEATKPTGSVPKLTDKVGFQTWVKENRFASRSAKAALIHPGQVFSKPTDIRPYFAHPYGLCAVCDAMFECVQIPGPSKAFDIMHKLGLIWLHRDVPFEFVSSGPSSPKEDKKETNPPGAAEKKKKVDHPVEPPPPVSPVPSSSAEDCQSDDGILPIDEDNEEGPPKADWMSPQDVRSLVDEAVRAALDSKTTPRPGGKRGVKRKLEYDTPRPRVVQTGSAHAFKAYAYNRDGQQSRRARGGHRGRARFQRR